LLLGEFARDKAVCKNTYFLIRKGCAKGRGRRL
jgi:hypothetical protein